MHLTKRSLISVTVRLAAMPSNAQPNTSDDIPVADLEDSGLEGFNLFDPEVQQCPHAYYAEMQKESGAFETDVFGTPIYLVTRYEDVATCAMEPSTFSSRFDAGGMEGNSEYGRRAQELYDAEGGYERIGTMLTVDPPEHTRYRRLVSQAFTPYIRSLIVRKIIILA